MSLGLRLRLFISVNGLTVREFSQKFDIPYRSVHEYLSDKRKPSAEQLLKMAENGIDINWLLSGFYRPVISFDLTACDSLRPIEGIVAADSELMHYLMEESVVIVNEGYEKIIGHPLGFNLTSLLASIWTVFSILAEGLDQHREKIEKLKSEGWSVAEIVDLTVGEPVRAAIVDRLTLIDPNQAQTSDLSPPSDARK